MDSKIIKSVLKSVSEAGQAHYLPHRPVSKESKTINVRIVSDAGSNASGPLNNCLYFGPFLCLKFLWCVCFLDTEKSCGQILLHNNDKDFTRLFWFEYVKNLNVTNIESVQLGVYIVYVEFYLVFWLAHLCWHELRWMIQAPFNSRWKMCLSNHAFWKCIELRILMS